MLFEELLQDREKEGEAKGQELMMQLITHMTNDNRLSDIPRLAKEPDFFQTMLKIYHLE